MWVEGRQQRQQGGWRSSAETQRQMTFSCGASEEYLKFTFLVDSTLISPSPPPPWGDTGTRGDQCHHRGFPTRLNPQGCPSFMPVGGCLASFGLLLGTVPSQLACSFPPLFPAFL